MLLESTQNRPTRVTQNWLASVTQSSFTSVTQNYLELVPQTKLRIDPRVLLEICSSYSGLILRALINLKLTCKDCMIKILNKIKQNHAKKP